MQGVHRESYEKMQDPIHRIKRTYSSEQLFEGHPKEFIEYMEYVQGLKFDEDPDYKWIKALFKNLFKNNYFPNDNLYDWDSKQ